MPKTIAYIRVSSEKQTVEKPTVTLDIYTHLMEKHRPEVAAKLESGISVAKW